MSFVEFTGTARLDKRTKRLVRRLGPDDIAIIDHRDLDRVSAEELLATNVRVVLNVSPSMSGRFPNAGPLELVRGGVRLIDVNGESDLFEEVRDGESLVVRGSSLFRNGSRLAAGHMLTEFELETELAEQRGRVTEALENFAENTLRYLRDEAKLLSEGVRLPEVQTRFRDRHALVVARGPGMKRDLRIVKPYIRDFRPVLVGVDGGADALIQAGYKPHVIVGDMDSVSDRALRPGLMRKPHGAGLIVIRRVSPASELAWHDLKQKLDMGIRLEDEGRHTTATAWVSGPFWRMYAEGVRSLPTKAVARLHDLCDTASGL